MHKYPKELLVEKYTPPTEIKIIDASSFNFKEFWFNKYEEFHNVNDQPCAIEYKEGKIRRRWWFKNGEQFRKRNRPTYVYYSSQGSINEEVWIKNDKFIHKKNQKQN